MRRYELNTDNVALVIETDEGIDEGEAALAFCTLREAFDAEFADDGDEITFHVPQGEAE